MMKLDISSGLQRTDLQRERLNSCTEHVGAGVVASRVPSVHLEILMQNNMGRDISVGIATGYGLDGPGIEGKFFRTRPDRSWGPPNPYKIGTGVSFKGRVS
jgi:hypothetical protein